MRGFRHIRLNRQQRRYARQTRDQIRQNGVAIIQLPTGQGKTLIALKVVAELLSRSKRPRPLVLVTRQMHDADTFKRALEGEPIDEQDITSPWIRDAFQAKGLRGLLKGRKPKIGLVEWRSIKGQNDWVPPAAIVIYDEVHRFQSFLRTASEQAYRDKPGPRGRQSRQRQYLLLSATPINPTRISAKEERGALSFEEEEQIEDNRIKTGYVNLYRAMIGLSSLSRTSKNELLSMLNQGEKQMLEEFAVELRKVLKVLKPIPDADDLAKLGPHTNTPPCPAVSESNAARYSRSVLGLLKFHESIASKTNLYYCAERMALAGVKAKRKKRRRRDVAPVGFWKLPRTMRKKGLFHHQPNTIYMGQTVEALSALDRNKRHTRRLLTDKIDALYEYLLKTWKSRSHRRKWRVLVYCAHCGSVAALAAALEERFHRDGIACTCPDADEHECRWIYGRHGTRRVVWDTEGYSTAERRESEQEKALIREFCRDAGSVFCGKGGKRCPRGFVLVTSDRLSESIDLHNECEVMVHFDLDWSPLRMIQRYGRLWRIVKPTQRPRPPAAFFMVQPGSVDEEILWRLERRWESLRKLRLGLELVDLRHALGTRLY